MGEVVNLRLARKQAARRERDAAAARNRAASGRTGTEKARSRQADERAGRFLDGHRLAGGARDEPSDT